MKALLIIAYEDYHDEEYGKTRQELEKVGIEVEVASTNLGEAKGKLGGRVPVDLLLDQVEVLKYDAIIFIGGPGAVNYINDKKAHKIAKKAVESNKILAAICIAPAILTKAGVLLGKKATVWTSEEDKEAIKILENGGAKYTDEKVVIDGKIITASGPQAAEEFGRKIVENLNAK